MNTSSDIQELAAAMVKVQSSMRPAVKDSNNPAFRSKYADLMSIWEACRVPLTSNGLKVWQDVGLGDGGVSVVTRIVHVSGQGVEFGPLRVPLSKADAHGVGSATTYAKRYALSAALGVVSDEDDDGNAASAKPIPTAKPVAKPEGYDDKMADLEAAADSGGESLKKAWAAQTEAFRNATPKPVRDKLKARAAEVKSQSVITPSEVAGMGMGKEYDV